MTLLYGHLSSDRTCRSTPLRSQRPPFVDVTSHMSSVVRHARRTPVAHAGTQVTHSFAIAHS